MSRSLLPLHTYLAWDPNILLNSSVMCEGDNLFGPWISRSFGWRYAGCREDEEKGRKGKKREKVNFSLTDTICIIRCKQIMFQPSIKIV